MRVSGTKPFAVFDIDGTLIRWQLYHAVADRLAKKNLLGPNAHNVLHEARMVWKRRERPDAFKIYEQALIKIYEEALPELTPKQFDEVSEEIATEYQDQVYTYTRDLVQSLKQKGCFLIAISGSHEELVGHIARRNGFDVWVGSRYERKDDVFTGKKFVASRDKRTVLHDLIKQHDLTLKGSVGVGDSESDVSFLEMVELPIAFNPAIELFNIAESNGWKIVVERKNVVYELEVKDGTYVLA